MSIWLIVVIGLTGMGIAGGIGWMKLVKEHNEARSVLLDGIDFSGLVDGKFHGVYEGGMYKWRANECDVFVSGGKVKDINLTGSRDPARENVQARELYNRVIEAQSLQVDTITSATLTSKAYLKAVENALIQAQHD